LIVSKLRGIVSYGPYYLSQQLIIGPAVDDAASNHAQLNWIGIALSPKVSIAGGNTVNNSVVYYNIRHKERRYWGIALNWPKFDPNRECYQILQKEHLKADGGPVKESTRIHSVFITMLQIFRNCHSLRRIRAEIAILRYIRR
jgi:hypothetical protein